MPHGPDLDPSVPHSRHQIAYRLALTRRTFGLTQTALCRLTGWISPRYSQWETGRSQPHVHQAITLCDIFGVTLDWIYRGDAKGLSPELRARLEQTQEHFKKLAVQQEQTLPPVMLRNLRRPHARKLPDAAE